MELDVLLSSLVVAAGFIAIVYFDERGVRAQYKFADARDALFDWRCANPNLRVCDYRHARNLAIEAIRRYDRMVAIDKSYIFDGYRERILSLLEPDDPPPRRRRRRLKKRPAQTRAISFKGG